MRVHITTEEYIVIDDIIDDIVWNKNPESRFQTKLDEFVIILQKIIYYVNYATCNKLLYCQHSLEQEPK